VDIFTYLLKYGGWFSGIMVLYCLLALGLVGFLGIFHCTLISAGQTTNERLKGLYKKKTNPHSRGLVKNWLTIVFAPKKPSNFNFRSFVDETEQKKCRRKNWPQQKRKTTSQGQQKSKQKQQAQVVQQEEEEQGGGGASSYNDRPNGAGTTNEENSEDVEKGGMDARHRYASPGKGKGKL